MKLDEKLKCIDILDNYKGKNTYILWVKHMLENDKTFILNSFHFKYIINNHTREYREINKVIKIADWFGEKKKKEWDIDFIPQKLKITHLMGEVDNMYHCFVVYRKSQPQPISCFIPKNAIITPLNYEPYQNLTYDTELLDKQLKKHSKGKRSVLKHQPDAIKFLLHTKKCILADSMGLGKTFETISATIVGGFNKVLIICPASVKSTWKREIGYFTNADDSVNIVNGKEWGETKKYNIINFDILNNFYTLPLEPKTKSVIDLETGKAVKVVVTKKNKHPKTGKITEEVVYKKSRNPELIEKTLSESKLLLEQFDLIIIDEVHKLSNSDAIRYKIIHDLIDRSKVENVYCLTGTPITNRPLNYYNILTLINAEISRDWRYFMLRYCDGKEIKLKGRTILKTNGSSNLDELRERTSHLYLRRLKTDIPDFPNKFIKEVWYELSKEELNEYNNIWSKYKEEQKIKNVDIDDDTLESYKALVENTILRKYLANIMVSRTIELAESHIEDGESVIIATTYNEELELLKKHFGSRCVVYHGGMSIKQKDIAENEFMNNPKIDVFIGQELSAGVGLTLTKANIVIFNSYDWIPGNNEQMQDRAFRIGQLKDVIVYFQNIMNTILERMYYTVKDKEYVISNVIIDEKEKKPSN